MLTPPVVILAPFLTVQKVIISVSAQDMRKQRAHLTRPYILRKAADKSKPFFTHIWFHVRKEPDRIAVSIRSFVSSWSPICIMRSQLVYYSWIWIFMHQLRHQAAGKSWYSRSHLVGICTNMHPHSQSKSWYFRGAKKAKCINSYIIHRAKIDTSWPVRPLYISTIVHVSSL